MQDMLTTAPEWLAWGSGMIAALMVSLDSGRRVTGWGFVIDLLGVYRYLIRQKPDG